MLSKSCEYALRAVVYIAANSGDDRKAGIKEISKSLKMPAPFLAKILQNLAKGKILASVKGPNGGFYLNKNPKKISFLNIVESVDGLDYFNKCALGLKRCSNEKPCPAHFLVKKSRDEIRAALSDKTLDQVIQELNDKKVYI